MFDKKGGLDRFFQEIVNPEGDYCDLVHLGPYIDGSHYIGVCHPDGLKQLFTDVTVFRKHPVAYGHIDLILGNGLVTSDGDLWKHERKLLTPVFHLRSLKSMLPLMFSLSQKFVQTLKTVEGQWIDCHPYLSGITLEILMFSIFGGGFDIDSMIKAWGVIHDSMNDYLFYKFLFGKWTDYIPFSVPARMRKQVKQVRQKVYALLEQRKKEYHENLERKHNYNDLIMEMVKAQYSENEAANKIFSSTGFSREELISDECLTFLIAGHETISNLLSWCLYLLGKHPEVQTKLQKEVDLVFKSCSVDEHLQNQNQNQNQNQDDDVEYYVSLVKQLPYCKQTLEETMRFRPPLPGFLDRITTTDCTVLGTFIPAGTTVTPLSYCCHHSTKFWKNPEVFDPDRFSPESQRTHTYSFVPFSAGSRNCIGQKFAMQEATLLLSVMMRHFTIETHPQDKVIMAFTGTVTPLGISVRFIPRKDVEIGST